VVELITRYFVQHNEVGLPGLGKLSAVPVEPKYDAARQVMVPPRLQFQWQPLSGESESMQSLAGFVSRQSQLSEEESFDAINGFCAMVKSTLEEKGEYRWNGLGKLVKIATGNTGFVPDAALDAYLPPLEAVRVVKAGQSHQMLVGDKETNTADMQQFLLEENEPETEGKWWIAALVIGVAVSALIVGRLGGWI
jgi:hypothetical protein